MINHRTLEMGIFRIYFIINCNSNNLYVFFLKTYGYLNFINCFIMERCCLLEDIFNKTSHASFRFDYKGRFGYRFILFIKCHQEYY